MGKPEETTLTVTEVLPKGELALPEIAARIVGLHKAAEGAARAAFECGQMLVLAKERVPHGEFQEWVERETGIKADTARKYMRLAKRDDHRVLLSSKTVEHYTPDIVLEHVIRVLGDIDLDPCADPDHNVPAQQHFTEERDGLLEEWRGRVFMNPPYGTAIKAWSEKLLNEYQNGLVTAVALIPARTDTEWFGLYKDCPICFVRGRLTFKGNNDPAPFPSAIAYFGPDEKRFIKEFRELGDIWRRLI
jgi:hypothetical protein